MGKVALIVLLVIAALIWFRLKARADSRDDAVSPTGKSEAMLECVRCGVHLPSSEAVVDRAGRAFCSVEHCNEAARTP